MPRCLSCGRRVAGVHPPCAGLPAAAPAAGGPLPEVPGFRPLRLLGEGGFGRVALAARLAGGPPVALKVARRGSEAAAGQLRREAAALRAVGPPAVPAVLDAGALPDGTPWLALERLPGESLAARLEAAGGALPPAEALEALGAVARALAAVHGAGWAHGDLKPENVLLDGAPLRARLLDLGLAEPLREGPGPAGEAPAGTAEYMAPERCEGRGADARADVYALGALAFELLTGRPPFFGPPGEVRHAHLTRRPPRPSSLVPLAPGLEALVLACLAKAPADRPASAMAPLPALDAAKAGAPAAATPAEAPAPARAPRRPVAVVFLETPASAVALRGALSGLGGVVAHAERGRCALVFDPAGGEHPVRQALGAARAALVRGQARRCRVDLVTVTVQARAGGGDRYLSAAFGRPEAWPAPGDPAGVLVTAAAAEVLPGEPLAPLPGLDGLLLAGPADQPEEGATVIRQGAPPLLGRDELLVGLVEEAQAAFRGRPTLVRLAGEAGLGKSHLGAALADALRLLRPAPRVLEVRARAPGEGGEGGVLRALLRAALELPPGPLRPPPDGGRALLGMALPEASAEALWPGAALALGWLAPTDPALRAQAAAPGALAGLAVRAVGSLLRRLAGARPLALILDDAHQADGPALDALEHAALAEAGAPLFACVLARPALATARPAFGERAAASRAVELGPLDPAVAGELCRQLLRPAEGIPARAVERLVARAGGVPQLLVELARGLKRAGALRRHAGGGAHYLATDALELIPDMPLVAWLAENELRGLPADLVAHAWLAALLGDEVAPAELAGVLEGLEQAGHGATFPLDAGVATRRLLSQGVLSAHRGGRTGFRLALLRDAVTRAVPGGLRVEIHRAAHRYYQRATGLPEPVRLLRLATHADAAGHAAEAGAAWLALASAALARHDFVAADTLLSRALEGPLAGAPRQEALRHRGNARVRLGRLEDAVADLAAAGAAARARQDRDGEVDCLLDEATALDFMQAFAASRARVEEAGAMARPSGPVATARLELARGRSLFREARWHEAAAALETAAALVAGRGDEGYETWVVAQLLLGTSLPSLGRAPEAEAALAQVVLAAGRRGDLLHLCVAHTNRRNLLVAQGDLPGALAGQLESRRVARELGMTTLEFMAEFNCAELRYQAGDLAGAAPHVERALELERRHPEISAVPLALLLAARMAAWAEGPAARGRWEALARAREEAERLRGGRFGPSDAVLADLVELATREADDGAWEALLERSRRHSVEQEPIEVQELRGLALLRAGRREAARAALGQALALCDRIPSLLRRRVEAGLAAAG